MTVNRAAPRGSWRSRCAGVCAALVLGSASAAAQPIASNDPIRIGPYLHDLGPTSVEIRAVVDPPGPLDITITKAGDGGAPRALSSKPSSMHVVPIDGLEPRTRYEYVATSGKARVRGELVTAPPEADTTPFTALVYGDNRTDDHAHELVVRAMLGAPSDLLLHTGDFVDDPSREVEWKQFFDPEAPLLRDRCVFTTIGNHEYLDAGRTYRQFFGSRAPGMERANDQTMRWQFARFYFVDAQSSAPERWLPAELAKHASEPGVTWRVVVLHQGPYASGPHGPHPDITTSLIDGWVKAGVDLVLAGHDHLYERGFANGLRYVVTGGGGAPPYKVEQRMRGTRKVEPTRHYVRLEIAPDRIKLAARRPDGSLVEEVSFDKTVGWSDDPPKDAPKDAPKPPPEPAPEPPPTSWTPWAIGAGVIGATALLLIARRRRYRK